MDRNNIDSRENNLIIDAKSSSVDRDVGHKSALPREINGRGPQSSSDSKPESLPPGEPSWLLQTYRGGKSLDAVMKQRKIPKSFVSLTGKLQSLKQDIASHFESPLEQDYLKLLEFDWRVAAFIDQPLTISYQGEDNKIHSYTPDVLVHYGRTTPGAIPPKSQLIEIKTKRDLAEHGNEYKARFAAATRYAADRGWEFRILTEADIRTPYLDNAVFLLPFRNYEIINPEYGTLLRVLRKNDCAANITTLLQAAASELEDKSVIPTGNDAKDQQLRGRLMAMTWYLLAEGTFQADFKHERVNLNSRVWFNGINSNSS